MTAEPMYRYEMGRYVLSIIFLLGHVFMVRWINRAAIEKLKSAHVLVVPSSYEGFGIVYLEGMGLRVACELELQRVQRARVIEQGDEGYLIEAGRFTGHLPKHLQSTARKSRLVETSFTQRSQPGISASLPGAETAQEYSRFRHSVRLEQPGLLTWITLFTHYLLAKQTVDDRALNNDVVQALRVNLPPGRFR